MDISIDRHGCINLVHGKDVARKIKRNISKMYAAIHSKPFPPFYRRLEFSKDARVEISEPALQVPASTLCSKSFAKLARERPPSLATLCRKTPSTSFKMLVSAEKVLLVVLKNVPEANPASEPSVRPCSGTHTIPNVTLHLLISASKSRSLQGLGQLVGSPCEDNAQLDSQVLRPGASSPRSNVVLPGEEHQLTSFFGPPIFSKLEGGFWLQSQASKTKSYFLGQS